MSYKIENANRFHGASFISTPAVQPRLQVHAIRAWHPGMIGEAMSRAWRVFTKAGQPDVVELHMGVRAYSAYQQHLRDQERDDSDPTAVGPGGIEATVYHMPSLAPDQLVFLSYREKV